jgi:hypothetical protein
VKGMRSMPNPCAIRSEKDALSRDEHFKIIVKAFSFLFYWAISMAILK